MANESLAGDEDIPGGGYRLGAVISRSARSTVCETESGGAHAAAVIKVRVRAVEEGEHPDDPVRQWRGAMELEHPNLLKIYAVGSSTFNGDPVAYAVMERADESLAGILPARPLTGEEARQMLVSATAALRYLHEKGYAHSRLRPSNVLAVGEQVKLSSDSVTRMADGGSTAEDMRALGALIVQALTQRLPNGDGDEDSKVDVPRGIPQPFEEVARHCLDPDPASRWTAGQVLARLTAPEAERPLPIPAAAPPSLTGQEEPYDEDVSTRAIPRWIYAGLAALVLIVFLAAWLRERKPTGHARIPATAAEQTPPADAPAAAPFSSGTPAPQVDSAPVVAGASDRKADGWAVIAATYASREPAEKRMRAMAKRWPRFSPSIFQPHTGKPDFIVVLGQNLSEARAEALRKRAVAAGLPRDTYIKKLM